jgi:hypothetical protein
MEGLSLVLVAVFLVVFVVGYQEQNTFKMVLGLVVVIPIVAFWALDLGLIYLCRPPNCAL